MVAVATRPHWTTDSHRSTMATIPVHTIIIIRRTPLHRLACVADPPRPKYRPVAEVEVAAHWWQQVAAVEVPWCAGHRHCIVGWSPVEGRTRRTNRRIVIDMQCHPFPTA